MKMKTLIMLTAACAFAQPPMHLTLADAQRVIKQYYPLDNLVFVVIGFLCAQRTYAARLLK